MGAVTIRLVTGRRTGGHTQKAGATEGDLISEREKVGGQKRLQVIFQGLLGNSFKARVCVQVSTAY